MEDFSKKKKLPDLFNLISLFNLKFSVFEKKNTFLITRSILFKMRNSSFTYKGKEELYCSILRECFLREL